MLSTVKPQKERMMCIREFEEPVHYWTQKNIAEWNDEMLGGTSLEGIIKHLKEEIGEFFDDLGTLDERPEAADIVILLMLYAKARGFDLLGEVDKKMGINVNRKWLPPDENGVIRHDPDA